MDMYIEGTLKCVSHIKCRVNDRPEVMHKGQASLMEERSGIVSSLVREQRACSKRRHVRPWVELNASLFVRKPSLSRHSNFFEILPPDYNMHISCTDSFLVSFILYKELEKRAPTYLDLCMNDGNLGVAFVLLTCRRREARCNGNLF